MDGETTGNPNTVDTNLMTTSRETTVDHIGPAVFIWYLDQDRVGLSAAVSIAPCTDCNCGHNDLITGNGAGGLWCRSRKAVVGRGIDI